MPPSTDNVVPWTTPAPRSAIAGTSLRRETGRHPDDAQLARQIVALRSWAADLPVGGG